MESLESLESLDGPVAGNVIMKWCELFEAIVRFAALSG